MAVPLAAKETRLLPRWSLSVVNATHIALVEAEGKAREGLFF
jgi:hypothetical protein